MIVVNNNNSVRKSNVYLDVPTMNMQHLQVSDPDIVRTFSSSNKGIVNRGDSFRRRRSRSNSLAPVSPMQAVEDLMVPTGPEESFKVLMLGGAEVGKAALLAQFRTSECINAYEGGRDSPGLQTISIILNGIESELQFVKETLDSREELESADAFLVVYSVVDKPSFQKAEQIIMTLADMDLSRTRPIILVANKIDLARSRAISSQDGRCLACTHRTKFIEVSVGINHNVDELLAGTLTQIRLKKEQNEILKASKDPSGHWYKNRNVVRASMKARQMVSWIFGKEDSKFRNCENLQVL
uniref:CSON007515 protein n=1 Tax=Culicoides sonorensis TaxID=179676 RepID=A0A336MYD8_CULSO